MTKNLAFTAKTVKIKSLTVAEDRIEVDFEDAGASSPVAVYIVNELIKVRDYGPIDFTEKTEDEEDEE